MGRPCVAEPQPELNRGLEPLAQFDLTSSLCRRTAGHPVLEPSTHGYLPPLGPAKPIDLPWRTINHCRPRDRRSGALTGNMKVGNICARPTVQRNNLRPTIDCG